MSTRIIAFLATTVLLSAVSITATHTTIPRLPKNNILDKQMSKDAQYRRLFAQIWRNERRARGHEANGVDGSTLRAKLPASLGLDPYQGEILLSVACSLQEAVTDLDAKAHEIIRTARIEQQRRLLEGLDRVPITPPELKLLQQHKDSLFLQARNAFHASLEQEAIEKFEFQLESQLRKIATSQLQGFMIK